MKKNHSDISFWIIMGLATMLVGLIILQYFVPTEQVDFIDHQLLSWVFAMVATAYAGVDKMAQFSKSSQLPFGQIDDTRRDRILPLIYLHLALLAIVFIATLKFNIPNLTTEPLFTGLGGCCGSYVAGNKAMQIASTRSGTHSKEEIAQLSLQL